MPGSKGLQGTKEDWEKTDPLRTRKFKHREAATPRGAHPPKGQGEVDLLIFFFQAPFPACLPLTSFQLPKQLHRKQAWSRRNRTTDL